MDTPCTVKIAFLDGNTTSWTVTGLTNGTEYGFAVMAYVNDVWTGYSETVYESAGLLEITTGDGYAFIDWDDLEGAEHYAIFLSYVGGVWSDYSKPTYAVIAA